MKQFLISFFVVGSLWAQAPYEPINIDEVESQLMGEGLEGRIHGNNQATGTLVFTYRSPTNFFSFMHFPMISKDSQVKKIFLTLQRHDKVKIKGHFVDNEAPKKHMNIDSIVVLEKGSSGMPGSEDAPLPREIQLNEELIGIVHIVEGDGSILVIDYQGVIFPVFVTKPELTQGLYRNDIIRLRYKVRSHPGRPTHLELNADAEEPVKVLDRMVDHHGKEEIVEGSLVLFPKSEQVSFDVFAVQVKDQYGNKRNFTLMNPDDSEIFSAIRKKLGSLWEQTKAMAVNDRNKWINPSVRLTVKGKMNVIDPGQANTQIFIEGPEAIKAQKLVCAWEDF